jgi:hypothetical protein
MEEIKKEEVVKETTKPVDQEVKVEQKPEEKVKPEKKSKKPLLIIVIAVLSFLVIALVTFIIFTSINKNKTEDKDNDTVVTEEDEDEDTQDTDEDQDEEIVVKEDTDEEDVAQTEVYNGVEINATIPTGWKITEYFDGEGTNMLNDDVTYTGLTGLAVTNGSGKLIFSLKAVGGIGFVGCSDYAKFDDENTSYYDQNVLDNEMTGMEMTVHDYTNTEYQEFEWLGTTFRRVGLDYYYDTEEGNNYFEPPCQPGLLSLEGLFFEDEDGYVGQSYFYGPEDDAQESDLLLLDDVLESMEAK